MHTIALVGNPNSGKTTLFNALTGSTAYVGNWPGVTVEKKEGLTNGHKILDLPGIYSLSPYSPEEQISRRYILNEQPDLIIDVIDATNLERSLYLSTQLAELGRPLLLALNMEDLLVKDGIAIDTKRLSQMFGTPVVQISATKGTGIAELKQEIEHALSNPQTPPCPLFSSAIERKLTTLIEDDYLHEIPHGRQMRWAAIKLLEGDELFLDSMPPIPPELNAYLEKTRSSLEELYDDDVESIIVDQRYKVAERLARESLIQKEAKEKRFTFDMIATHRIWAIPLFILIMSGVFFLSVGVVGGGTTALLEGFFENLAEWVTLTGESWQVHPFLIGILSDGIIAGVGAVLTFVPQLFILFLLLSILEDCGYMARIAFIMDRQMRSMGLSGKSIIPLVIGTGCTVPAIMSTRTIEHQKQRELTIIVTPFIPCGAKMPIFALMLTYFFRDKWYMAPLMYVMGILAVIVTGLLARAIDRHKETNAFILELPRYQMPSPKSVWRQTKDRTLGFIYKAGTIILLASIVIYLLSSYSFAFKAVDAEESMLALLGRIAPVFIPLGFGFWQAAVALLTGIAAKETIVSTLSVVIGTSSLTGFFDPAGALAFMTFILLSSPCVAAMAAMLKELGSKRKFIFAILWQFGFAYLVSLLVRYIVLLII